MEQHNERIFEFEAEVERFAGIGSGFRVFVPISVPDEFGTRGTVRVRGFMNQQPIERALLPHGDGTHFLLLSHKLCKGANVQHGQVARFRLQQDHRVREAVIPEELEVAFDLEPEAKSVFESLAPSYQRNICDYISEAKRPETREQRMNMMLNRLLTGYFKPAKKAKAES